MIQCYVLITELYLDAQDRVKQWLHEETASCHCTSKPTASKNIVLLLQSLTLAFYGSSPPEAVQWHAAYFQTLQAYYSLRLINIHVIITSCNTHEIC